jgi:hypothetical protein
MCRLVEVMVPLFSRGIVEEISLQPCEEEAPFIIAESKVEMLRSSTEMPNPDSEASSKALPTQLYLDRNNAHPKPFVWTNASTKSSKRSLIVKTSVTEH